MYAAYDLELDDPEVVGSVEQTDAKDDGLMRFDESTFLDERTVKRNGPPVKALRVKSHVDVLKMVSNRKERGSEVGQDDDLIESLEDQFGEILLSDNYKVVNS